MHRREFLRTSVFLSGVNLGFIPLAFDSSAKESKPLLSYVAASRSRLGETSLVCLNSLGVKINQYDTPSRGHSFALSNKGHVAAIARRPADFCVILDIDGNKIAEFNASESRHFYGHGVYDLAGDFLYLTENDYGYKGTRGVVGVYSVSDGYTKISEFESGGIGPHQIILNGDGSELIVANGGIQTHPESGRKKLNLSSMTSSLAFIDRKTGVVRHNLLLENFYSTNSIRHIALHSSGQIYIALQQQVKSKDDCLLAVFDPQKNSLSKLPLSQEHENMLSGYVGDISLDISEQYLAMTSPYGNALLVMSLIDKSVSTFSINDICGLSKTSSATEFIATTGDGRLFLINRQEQEWKLSELSSVGFKTSWDNHLLSLI